VSLRACRVLSLALVLTPATALASHTTLLTRDEEGCQRALGRATDDLGAIKAACLAACDRDVFRGRASASECSPPFDGQTRACVDAAISLARGRIDRGCARDCPECYPGGCRAFRDGAILATEAVVDGLASTILCPEPDLAPAEARCRQRVALVLGRLAVGMGKCIVRCRRLETRGRLTPGACTEPPPDHRVVACLRRRKARARRAIARRCADPPECLAEPLPSLIDQVETQVTADYRFFIFCASPSGAFLPGA
jgi:hypothetical protein